MSDLKLGRLEKVRVRDVWKTEPEFTKWLVRENNLKILSDEINVEITKKEREVPVGTFFADIVAYDENLQKKIVIENQFGRTNHDHLGKLLTYASGENASIVIWIAEEIKDEHKSAIKWLNDHSDSETDFFLVKLELFRIKDSPPAPKFSIVVSPDDWLKFFKSKPETFSKTERLRVAFWSKFKEYMQDHKTFLSLRKVNPYHWYSISVGSSNAHISLTISTRDRSIGCELYIPDNKDLFDWLFENKVEIEKELGFSVDWLPLKGKKASTVRIKNDIDPKNEELWGDAFSWLKDMAECFHKVFSKKLQEYPKMRAVFGKSL